MDPSTSDKSYGPFTIARDASAKFAISISPTSASSSSSQSSKLSWQPSQEANFHTASFGFCFILISNLPLCKQSLDSLVREYWSIFTNKVGSILAMSTHADCTLHVALH